jgi:hypothetical protein
MMKLINCSDQDVRKRAAKLVDKYLAAATKLYLLIGEFGDIDRFGQNVKKRAAVGECLNAVQLLDEYLDTAADLYFLFEEREDIDRFEVKVWFGGGKKSQTIVVKGREKIWENFGEK